MAEVVLDLPAELLAQALALESPTDEAVSSELRMLVAVKLYEMRRLSTGVAAQLAGVPRVEFLQRLGEYGVNTFSLTRDELEQDLDHARRYS